MAQRSLTPVALSIAGSDSGGGAGLQADLKTFAALGVHGTTVVTCLTAQNPKRVRAIQAASPELIAAQLHAVFEELPPAAAKTGMLYTPAAIRIVTNWFSRRNAPPLVVDPVMISTSRASLLPDSARRELVKRLLPLATLLTPNLDEAAALLTGSPVRSVEAMRSAARQLRDKFGCVVLLKGGHLPRGRQAVDIFWDGQTELLLEAPFVPGISTHGTGCTYAAAITAYLALGHSLRRSVCLAKDYISGAIAASYRVARHHALNNLWRSAPGKFA